MSNADKDNNIAVEETNNSIIKQNSMNLVKIFLLEEALLFVYMF